VLSKRLLQRFAKLDPNDLAAKPGTKSSIFGKCQKMARLLWFAVADQIDNFFTTLVFKIWG
jgi:hypothetical protein